MKPFCLVLAAIRQVSADKLSNVRCSDGDAGVFPKHRFWDPLTSCVLKKRVNIVVESTGLYHDPQIYLQYFLIPELKAGKEYSHKRR